MKWMELSKAESLYGSKVSGCSIKEQNGKIYVDVSQLNNRPKEKNVIWNAFQRR